VSAEAVTIMSWRQYEPKPEAEAEQFSGLFRDLGGCDGSWALEGHHHKLSTSANALLNIILLSLFLHTMPSPKNPLRVSGLLKTLHESAHDVRDRLQGGVENARANARDVTATAAAFVEQQALSTRYVDLDIQFIGARELPVMDINTGAADPYFRAKLGTVSFVCVRSHASISRVPLKLCWHYHLGRPCKSEH
jgi:hypothetical protein